MITAVTVDGRELVRTMMPAAKEKDTSKIVPGGVKMTSVHQCRRRPHMR
jgi:hypothetical protein